MSDMKFHCAEGLALMHAAGSVRHPEDTEKLRVALLAGLIEAFARDPAARRYGEVEAEACRRHGVSREIGGFIVLSAVQTLVGSGLLGADRRNPHTGMVVIAADTLIAGCAALAVYMMVEAPSKRLQ